MDFQWNLLVESSNYIDFIKHTTKEDVLFNSLSINGQQFNTDLKR